MNECELLRKLGTQMSAKPDREVEPGIDVAAGVIRRIRQRPASVVDPHLSLVTAGACALSAVVVLVAWSVGASPASESFASLQHAAVASTDPETVLRVLEP